MDRDIDVFLSFDSEAREVVRKIAIHLEDEAGLGVWFDEWQLIPGESAVHNIERGLQTARTCALFVGADGQGPWQRKEVEAAIRNQIQNEDFRVIPVLLPDAPKPDLPPFLANNTWVEFSEELDDPAMWRLECGIRGQAPGLGRPRPSTLTRIYANNFRCLVNFELHLGSVTLLMGPNGAGKSTIFDLIKRIRAFVVEGCRVDEAFGREHLTSWQDRLEQQFELDIAGESGIYTYRLQVEHYPEKRQVRVGEESLRYGKHPLFESSAKTGKAQLYRDDGGLGGEYLFDWSRSGIAVPHERPENKLLTWFKKRLGDILVVRLNPMLIGPESREKVEQPNLALTDFASWYRFLSEERPKQVMRFHSALREVMPDFDKLRLRPAGEGELLEAVFAMETPGPRRIYKLDELSDGQRALIALYALIHCLPESGATLCIDEPENFIALPEIQPWLDEFDTLCTEGPHQGLLISHHPRPINLLAREAGLWIDRSGSTSPTRVRAVSAAGEETGIAMDQLVERGWIFDD